MAHEHRDLDLDGPIPRKTKWRHHRVVMPPCYVRMLFGLGILVIQGRVHFPAQDYFGAAIMLGSSA